jgi:anaerobic ribonucleoside-triphosphate reductase activating protein
MVKYYNAMVVFEEIPDEITLAINITNCPCRCKGCHSKFLWEDVGTLLTTEELDKLIEKNNGITTVCFMGGDNSPVSIDALAEYIHEFKHLKVGWYSGKDYIAQEVDLHNFDFVKIGHYDDKYGGLDKETTNQIIYKVHREGDKQWVEDITNLFWKKKLK